MPAFISGVRGFSLVRDMKYSLMPWTLKAEALTQVCWTLQERQALERKDAGAFLSLFNPISRNYVNTYKNAFFIG